MLPLQVRTSEAELYLHAWKVQVPQTYRAVPDGPTDTGLRVCHCIRSVHVLGFLLQSSVQVYPLQGMLMTLDRSIPLTLQLTCAG